MRRGTTPTIRFKVKNLPSMEFIENLWIDFENKGNYKIVVHKELSDVSIDEENKTISVDLSEEDTLNFRMNIVCQIKILLKDGKVCASAVKGISIGEILNAEKIGGEVNE